MANMNKVAKEIKKAMTESDDKKPKAFDTEAVVANVEDNTLWVKFPGSDIETPVRKTVDAKIGDTVMVRVANHRAWNLGNATNPPTDDTRANQVGAAARQSIDFVAELADKDVTVRSITAATGYIDDLYSKNITTENLYAAHVVADELTANYADLNFAHISSGVIDNAKIGYADVQELHSHYAQLDAANIDTATIQDAWIDNLMVQSGLISHEGTIYELDAIQVNASKIKTGTLDVERLIVSVPDPQDPTKIHKYMVHVDPSTGQPSYEKVDADVLEDLTITADKIVAGAVTAEKITTENIIGSGGWINLRNGTFEYQNATTGDGITWDGQHLTIRGDVTITSNNYYTKNDVDGLISDIQDQIDGVIDTWYYSGDPTISNPPASSWITDTDRYNHLRDLYFNTDNGHSFRWALEKTLDTAIVSGKRYYTYNSSTGKYDYVTNPVASALSTYYEYEWIQITDADAIRALADAAKAQETADGKRRVFVAQPTNAQAYDVGDLWVNATYGTTYNNDILKCKTAKAADAAFNIAHWELASKYTDDSNVYKKSDFSISPSEIIGKVTAIEGWEIGGRNYCADFIHQDGGTGNGLTFTYNDDGSWRINGTATADVSRALYFIINGFSSLGYGDTYTLSIDSSMPSGARLYYNFANSSSTTAVGTEYGEYGANTFTFETNESYRIRYVGIVVKNGATVDFTFRMKLEKGNRATDWSPAPEDTDDKITELNTAISATAEAITLEASRRESATNLLLDSDAPDLTKVYGPANRYWSNGSTTSVTTSYIESNDTPEAGIEHIARFVGNGTNTANVVRGYTFYDDGSGVNGIPLVAGQTYTATWWARYTSTSGDGLKTRITYPNGAGATSNQSSTPENLTNKWKIYSHTFTLNALNTNYNRIWFEAYFATGKAGTIEICGCKLIAGDSIEEYKSSITQTADKISLVVKSGTSASNLELTDAAINAVADNMVIKSSTDNSKTVIQGGKLYADQIEIGSLSGEIGGTNLLRGTGQIRMANANWNKSGWYKSGTGTIDVNVSITDSPVSGLSTAIKLTSTDATKDIGVAQGGVPLKGGQKVTLSAWVKGTAGDRIALQPVWANASGAAPEGGSKYFTIASADNNKWVKYSYTKTVTYDHPVGTQSTADNSYVNAGYVYLSKVTSGHTALVTGIKLEYGDKATDWSPAPEDGSATNLIPWPYYRVNLSGDSYTSNGITWTCNKDGSITATGTATADSWYHLAVDYSPADINGEYHLPAGTYTLSGCPTGGSGTTYFLNIAVYTTPSTSTGYSSYSEYGNGKTFTTSSAQKYARIQMCIKSGCTCPSGGYTFYPMLEVGGVMHSFASPRVNEGAASTASAYITHIDSAGIWITPSGKKPTNTSTGAGATGARINASGMQIFKGGTSIAEYGDSARIGASSTRHVVVNTGGMQVFYDSSNVAAHLGYGSGNKETSGQESAPYFSFGSREFDSASDIGNYSVAEGVWTKASGFGSHAEGKQTIASGTFSHAEGYFTEAYGIGAHASGIGTKTNGQGQTAVGKYNSSTGLFVVGKGTANDSRSDALVVDGSGNLTIAGAFSNSGYNSVGSSVVKQKIGTVTPAIDAYRFGNFVWLKYYIANVSLSAGTSVAILSLYQAIRPHFETCFPANIVDSSWRTIGTGLVRFETGGWVYLIAPKTLSQTSSLYVVFTAFYML